MNAPEAVIAILVLVGLALWGTWTNRHDEADERDPNVVAFKRDYPMRASWRNGAPRKPAA